MSLVPQILPAAALDLDEIWEYISQDNLRAADKIIDTLNDAFHLLCEQPRMGMIFDRTEEIFRFISGNYVVFYRVDDRVLSVLRVFHGARDIESLLHD